MVSASVRSMCGVSQEHLSCRHIHSTVESGIRSLWKRQRSPTGRWPGFFRIPLFCAELIRMQYPERPAS